MQEKSISDCKRILNISEAAASAEFRFQQEWNTIKPGTELLLSDKKPVKILSAGTWNTEAGPDFKDAKIKFGNKIIKGDVELHFKASDWNRHGHAENPAYSNVILHVVAEIDLPWNNSAIPLLLMKTKVSRTGCYTSRRITSEGRCKAFFAGKTPEEIGAFFTAAGLERFRNKAKTAVQQMIENGAEKTCLQMIFDAAGYKNNRAEFAELFSRFSRYDAAVRGDLLEAVLWGESGLMPDPVNGKCDEAMTEFTKNTWNSFWKIRLEPNEPIKWRRNSTRPYNSPERRLAALAVLLRKTESHPLAFFARKMKQCKSQLEFCNIVLEQLSISGVLWDGYINFKVKAKHPAALTGENRALEIAVNALFPSLYAYFKINNDKKSMDFTEKAWLKLPPEQENKITKTATEKWFNFSSKDRKTIFSGTGPMQGIIHIYKEFCAKNASDCKSCLLLNYENL